MAIETPAHEWPHAWRYATALVNGFAWSFLWFGLERLSAPPILFFAITILFVAPVLAFVARGWADFAAVVGSAVAASVAMSLLLLPGEAALMLRLAGYALLWWLPGLAASAGLYAVRRRFLAF